MTIFGLMEPQNGLGAGLVTAGIMLSPSASGVVLREYRELTRVLQRQPTGSSFSFEDVGADVESLMVYGGETAPFGSGSDSTGPVVVRLGHISSHRRADTPRATLDNSEVIAAIRSSLSLQIKELAVIVGVQRTHVYSWINGESQPAAQHRDRLQQVYRLARRWNQLCQFPAEDLIRRPETDGRSILDLLKDEDIDEPTIARRLEVLARERRQRQVEADARRPTAREVALRHGIDINKVNDQQQVIDAFTGKRSSPD